MNLRQLEAFQATMQSGSITAAAEALHISQPSVSRLISDLERSVSFPLFVRVGRGLRPTSEAREFFRSVERTFNGINQLRDSAEAIRTKTGGVISIGVIQSIATFELPRAVKKMHEKYDDINFMIQSRNTPAILDAIQSHQFDLGIVGRQPPYAGTEALYSTSAPYVCLLPEDHPRAASHGILDLEELAGIEQFVTFGGAFPDEMMEIDAQLSQKLQTNSRLFTTNVPVAAAFVRELGALAIADPFSAEQAVQLGNVVFRPIKQKLKYHISVVCKSREHLDRRALEFAEVIAAQIVERAKEVSAYSD